MSPHSVQFKCRHTHVGSARSRPDEASATVMRCLLHSHDMCSAAQLSTQQPLPVAATAYHPVRHRNQVLCLLSLLKQKQWCFMLLAQAHNHALLVSAAALWGWPRKMWKGLKQLTLLCTSWFRKCLAVCVSAFLSSWKPFLAHVSAFMRHLVSCLFWGARSTARRRVATDSAALCSCSRATPFL